MIKKIFTIMIFIIAFFMAGCTTFIPSDDLDVITLKYQAGEYLLLQDLNRNNVIIPQNTPVKLIVLTGEDWVKFYAYNSGEELLNSNRLLLLYKFADDFPDKKFNREFLESELNKLVVLKDASDRPKKAVKKEVKETKKSKKIKG